MQKPATTIVSAIVLFLALLGPALAVDVQVKRDPNRRPYLEVEGVRDCLWTLQHVQGEFEGFAPMRIYRPEWPTLLIQIRRGDRTVRLENVDAANFLLSKGYLKWPRTEPGGQRDQNTLISTEKLDTFGGGSGQALPEPAFCGDVDPIVGDWRWFTGSTVTFDKNGTVVAVRPDGSRNSGSWFRKGNEVHVDWAEGGYHDRLTVSPSGTMLSGKNQNGTDVSGTRIQP